MALPASDNFNRSDAATLGANWTPADASIPHKIVSNTCVPSDVVNDLSYWSADTFGNDHYAQVTVLGITNCGPAVRITGTGPNTGNAYLLVIDGTSHGIWKFTTNGTYTQLQSFTNFSTNDVAKLQVVGTTLKAYQNGSQVGTDQADSALSSGSAGIWNYNNSASSLDDWSGDNVGSVTPAQELPAFAQAEQCGAGWTGLVYQL